MPKTPTHNVRVPDDTWNRAVANAQERGTSVTALVVGRLEEFNAECEANPLEPAPAAASA